MADISKPLRIVLHLGAHKTATTYIQDKLAANVDRLAGHGITYLPLAAMRQQLTGPIARGESPGEALRALIAASGDRLVLSDENLLRPPRQIVRKPALYTSLAERVRPMVAALQGRDLTVAMALRSYDEMLPSLYCELIRHRPFVRWETTAAALRPEAVSWRPVIERLLSIVPEESLVLWDFGRFGELEPQVFELLLGRRLDLAGSDAPVRESLSGKAVAALAALEGTLDGEEIRRLVPAVTRILPRGDRYPAFQPFDPATRATLKARYLADLEEIRRGFPRVRWLGG